MIRFYLDEEPILKNVPTWQCRNPSELSHVLANLPELVVKETQAPAVTECWWGRRRRRRKSKPSARGSSQAPCLYRATDAVVVDLPDLCRNGIAPRHIDLRPFVLSGRETRVVPGGLTRVALREGSLVVNSSQGGGTKDTWVVED
jgi:uncharacterized circularly permuted ATP-grasp superfamily protein